MTLCNCSRCGQPCHVGGPKNEDARLLRRAKTPRGYCATCAATQFLKTTLPLSEILREKGPEILLCPHITAQFAAVMRSGGSDADPSEIDWNRLVANWELPVDGETQGGLDL